MVKEIKLAILSGKEIFAHSPIAKSDKESKLVFWDSGILSC
jgi:hypothetical protein